MLLMLKEKRLPRYQKVELNLSAEESVRYEGPRRGKFGSLLSLAAAQLIWPLWNKGLVQDSGPTSSPSPSREEDPSTVPCSMLFLPECTNFTLGT